MLSSSYEINIKYFKDCVIIHNSRILEFNLEQVNSKKSKFPVYSINVKFKSQPTKDSYYIASRRKIHNKDLKTFKLPVIKEDGEFYLVATGYSNSVFLTGKDKINGIRTSLLYSMDLESFNSLQCKKEAYDEYNRYYF